MTPDITLTQGQAKVLNQLKSFITSSDRIFALKGYAGTGKTTLVRFIIKHLKASNIPYKLLATTGRAAKILKDYTGFEANTIHHMIYKFRDLNKDLSEIDTENPQADQTGQLMLVFEPVTIQNEDKPTIYIVDESSMISDTPDPLTTQAKFGNGKLLTELIEYDKNPKSKFIFVGDPCQLPPITSSNSPALDPIYLRTTFHVGVQEAELTQIMRQTDSNDITSAAAKIRQMYQVAPFDETAYHGQKVWGRHLPLSNHKNICLHYSKEDMLDYYFKMMQQNGRENVIYVCRQNKTCAQLSNLIRQRLGYYDTINVGDLLMVIQNQQTTGLMNGDMVEVISINKDYHHTLQVSSRYHPYTNLRFIEARVRELFSGTEKTTLILVNTLEQNNNLDSDQQTGLFIDFAIRMKHRGITQKNNMQAFAEALSTDPYLNALRVSYGYAVTCHKAQGGEWDNVFVDMPGNMTLCPTKEKFQWIYTAMTRAKQNVHFVDEWYIEGSNKGKVHRVDLTRYR
ncbi:MAG: AAA family ATPase [Paludibacteraceae bacterium]|nr:AAA family ATPase [Paludibacteraceae bacterium]